MGRHTPTQRSCLTHENHGEHVSFTPHLRSKIGHPALYLLPATKGHISVQFPIPSLSASKSHLCSSTSIRLVALAVFQLLSITTKVPSYTQGVLYTFDISLLYQRFPSQKYHA